MKIFKILTFYTKWFVLNQKTISRYCLLNSCVSELNKTFYFTMHNEKLSKLFFCPYCTYSPHSVDYMQFQL
jgi:hypothetical protein